MPFTGNAVYQDLAFLGVIFDQYKVDRMQMTIRLLLMFLILSRCGYGQTTQTGNENERSASPLNYRVAHFQVADSTLIEALSKLSLEPIEGLHLGIEEVLRERFSGVPDRSIRFSLTLENASVRDIVETLCQIDSRYAWSTDGPSINVFPRETIGNSSYLLNRDLEEVRLDKIANPYEVLTPLAKLLPEEQLGYAGIGGGSSYPEPWSTSFKQLTVRQLMNRISEHIGPHGGWIWSGSKDDRFFFCFQYGFQR